MTVLLQISDTHFGTEQAKVADALLVLAAQLEPEMVVLSGDITQRAHASQFQAARAFVGRLGVPVLAIPGNHDIALFNLAERIFYPYKGYLQTFGGDLAPVYESPDLLVIGVNTTRAYRHKCGEVSAQQIDAVAHRLAGASPQQLRVVVVHQPVAVMHPGEVKNLLRGHTAACQRWASAGADVVMGGHIHLPYVMPLPAVARPAWAVQAGTAISRRVRPGVPNSVNVLRWGGDADPGQPDLCRVEQWDYAADQGIFARVKVTELWPDRTSFADKNELFASSERAS